MAEKIHYIPQFVLREFKEPGRSLLELKKGDATAVPRGVDHAGQKPDFWPPDIERKLMGDMDDAAAKILQNKVYGETQIHLTPEERRRLAQWFALWMIRVPKNLGRYRMLHDDLMQHPVALVWDYRTQYRARYQAMVHRLGSEAAAFLYHLQYWESELRPIHPPAEAEFHRGLTKDDMVKFADNFERQTWIWVSSGEEDFVIGDDPVCRVGLQANVYDRGLRTGDLQVTIPLSRKLSVMMHKVDKPDWPIVQEADPENSKAFNLRQIQNAVEYVWGPTQVSLRPDDENAAYGF